MSDIVALLPVSNSYRRERLGRLSHAQVQCPDFSDECSNRLDPGAALGMDSLDRRSCDARAHPQAAAMGSQPLRAGTSSLVSAIDQGEEPFGAGGGLQPAHAPDRTTARRVVP